MTKKRKHITFFRFFFPLIFLLYFGGITLFNHTHVVNGVIIVHSHPYNGEHNHSDKSLETIFFLSIINTFGDLPSHITPALWLTLISIMLIPALTDTCKKVMHGVISLRAPPSLFYSFYL